MVAALKAGLPRSKQSRLYTISTSPETDDQLEFARLISPARLAGPGVILDQCLIEGVRIVSSTALRSLDSTFQSADGANADLTGSSLIRTLVTESRLTGVKLNDAYISETIFSDCLMPMAQVQQVKTKRVRFERCNLKGAFFNGSQLAGAVFEACDLRGADFSGADIQGADLRRSSIDDIRLDPSQLKGVIVTSDQALYLARLIGLMVRE